MKPIVDLITHDSKNNEIVLIMIDDRPWPGNQERAEELQQRVNDYLGFALDGDLHAKYPETANLPFRIQLDTSTEPDPKTKAFIERINQSLKEYNTRITINVR